MNFLDVRTVIFSHFLTDAVCTALLAFLWYTNRKHFAGTVYWLFDFIFQTIAVLLIALRGSIPDWVSMGVSSTLVVAGALLGYIGLTLFVGKKSPQLHNYVLLAVFVLVHFNFIFIQPNLEARNLNLSLGLLIMCFQCVWLVFHRVQPGMRRMTLGVGLVFVLFCLVSIIRVVIILVSPQPSNDFFKTGLYDTLLLVSYQILLILLTLGLALMVNQRLLLEVKSQEEKFTKAFRSSPYAITLTRASDGQISEVNQAFITITGYSNAEVISKSALELQLWVHEQDRANTVKELYGGKVVTGREFQFRKKTGEIMTGLFSAEIIQINDQSFILSSIADITDRKRAEQEILQLNASLKQRVVKQTQDLGEAHDKLVRHEKLAELGQMAGGIGHELRNPLGIISNAVYYLKLVQADASDKIKEYLGIIETETSNSEKIITDLLAFARVSSVECAAVLVPELIQGVLTRFRPPTSVDVTLNLPPDLPKVFVDPRQMEQVLGNLTSNACQSMPKGGKLILSAGMDGDLLSISVQDTGMGITAENKKLIFEPLFTTKSKGIGLGLAVSRKLAEANGGRIEVESEPGKGSIFTLYLPTAGGQR